MTEMVSETGRAMRYRTAIVTLAWVAVGLIATSSVRYLMDNRLFNGMYGNNLLEVATFFLLQLLLSVVQLLPGAMFLVYVMRYYSRDKATILVSLACVLVAIYPVLCALISLLSTLFMCYLWAGSSVMIEVLPSYIGQSLRSLILYLPLMMVFIMMAVHAMKGMTQKGYVITAVAVGLFYKLIEMLSVFQNIADYVDMGFLYTCSTLAEDVGMMAFYIAFLLFGLHNRIPKLHAEQYKRSDVSA